MTWYVSLYYLTAGPQMSTRPFDVVDVFPYAVVVRHEWRAVYATGGPISERIACEHHQLLRSSSLRV